MGGDSSFERRFLDTLPTGVAIHVAGRLVYANPALLRMVRAERREDWLGRPVLDFVHPDDHATTSARIRAVYDKKGPADWVEIGFRRVDGTCFPAEVTASMVDWEGQPASQVVVVDVTRRKEAEQARRASEERYRRLVEELPLGVVVHSDGTVLWANREAARIVGTPSPDAHVGDDIFAWIAPEYRDVAQERTDRLFRGGHERVPFIDMSLVRRDGKPVEVELGGALIEWEGRPAAQVILQDVTERRRLERRVLQAQKNESMEVLAGGVAHDFNNLLVGILGSADLALHEMAPDAAERPLVERIAIGARRAADLARQMLAYAGRGRVVVDRIDLGTLVREMAGLLEATATRKATLRFDLAADLPAIDGDPTRLRQVVMNLVSNASDALGEGGGAITVATAAVEADPAALRSPYLGEDLPPGRYVSLAVSDTGEGMDADVLARLFDPFFTTKLAGRGLGLAAVLGIVRAHRGTIHVDSRRGRGTRFRVLLPASAAGPRDAGPAATAAAAADPAARRGAVLVVDDDETVRAVAGHMLRHAGFEVVEAADGESGLARFREREEATPPAPFDCVLLDLSMPRMDGREVLAALSTIRPDVRVVIFSGFAEHDLPARGADRPPLVFLQKPFDRAELLAAIDRALA